MSRNPWNWHSLLCVVAVWVGLSRLIFFWWAQLTVIDVVAALFCVALESEDIRLALYAIFYRLFFVPYVDVIKFFGSRLKDLAHYQFFASLDELYGVKMAWGKLERFGRI